MAVQYIYRDHRGVDDRKIVYFDKCGHRVIYDQLASHLTGHRPNPRKKSCCNLTCQWRFLLGGGIGAIVLIKCFFFKYTHNYLVI